MKKSPVTILGLGALGAECASTLANIGFKVRGWSLTKKSIDHVICHHEFENGPSKTGSSLKSSKYLLELDQSSELDLSKISFALSSEMFKPSN